MNTLDQKIDHLPTAPGVYLTVLAVAAGLTIRSIVRNLRGPHRPSAVGVLPTRAALRVCVTELEALNREQNERSWRLADDIGEEGAVTRWQVWAREWEQRVEDLSDRCRLDAGHPDPGVLEFGGLDEIARARDMVLALHRYYAAQVNRFAGEQAKLAKAAADALREARAALARPPPERR